MPRYPASPEKAAPIKNPIATVLPIKILIKINKIMATMATALD